uniref:Uncharacterized protein n=1 Tax=Arundo donax TaxID=35708 RepID=A0A0A9BUL3_ARUDO
MFAKSTTLMLLREEKQEFCRDLTAADANLQYNIINFSDKLL